MLEEQKAEWRGQVRARLKSLLASNDQSLMDRKIREHLSQVIDSSPVAVFVGLADEPRLWPEISMDLGDKLAWALPKMSGASLKFYRVDAATNLIQAQFGVREPATDGAQELATEDLKLICVPGVAFDRAGRRLGRGKGFYDRALEGANAVKLGVCYSPQLIDGDLPHADHDVRMDYVVTEKFILKVKG